MEEFTIELREGQNFTVRLSISLQHELCVYVEPIVGQPDTYEIEGREYIVTAQLLGFWCTRARKAAVKYDLNVQDFLALERLGATYADVHRIVTHEEPQVFISNNLFEADEDLMFLYTRLAVLHSFVFEAREAIIEFAKANSV